jgi:alpha-N-acetylglucosaminidase
MVILDYFSEKEEVWRRTQAWYGAPYVWCYLGNFGGNTELAAPFNEIARRLTKTEIDTAHGKLYGIGSTLEGFGVNRLVFEWLFEYAWNKDVTDIAHWISEYAKMRTKNNDPIAEEAYKRLIDIIYNDKITEIGAGSFMQARPFLEVKNCSKRPMNYNHKELFNNLTLMLSANDKSLQSLEFQRDLVVITKQILDNLLIPLHNKIYKAYIDRNIMEVENLTNTFLEVMSDQDRLLATQTEFLLGRWVNSARQFGNDSTSKAYYEKNARVLISTWANEGNWFTDYASRDLSGLISSYYKARWALFFEELNKSLKMNVPLNLEYIKNEMVSLEWNWTNQQQSFMNDHEGNPLNTVTEIHKKYRNLINRCYDY